MSKHLAASIPLMSALMTLGAGRSLGTPAADDAPDPETLRHRIEQTERKLRELSGLLDAAQAELSAERQALDQYRRSPDSELGQVQGKGGPQGADQPAPVGEAPRQSDAPAPTAQIFDEPTALTPAREVRARDPPRSTSIRPITRSRWWDIPYCRPSRLG